MQCVDMCIKFIQLRVRYTLKRNGTSHQNMSKQHSLDFIIVCCRPSFSWSAVEKRRSATLLLIAFVNVEPLGYMNGS